MHIPQLPMRKGPRLAQGVKTLAFCAPTSRMPHLEGTL
jgi:hypothetical protein